MEAAVVGAGTMGAGIAQLLAQQGIGVRIVDVSETVLDKAEAAISAGLVRAGKPEALAAVRKTVRLEDVGGCDLVIEAVAERLDVKLELFARLGKLVDPSAFLATNTSSLSVGKIAESASQPERVLGLHFFNPAPVMRLVEVVRAERTSESAIRFGMEIARRLGKTPVLCRDTPGFIANRVARPFYLAGMRLLEGGAGSPLEIDRAVRERGGFKMGPLELVDLIGLEVNLAITEAIYEGLGRPDRFKPCEVQRRLVERGEFGRKSGKGFYLYGGEPRKTKGPPAVVNPAVKEIVPGLASKPLPAERLFGEVLDGVIDEARRAASEAVASEDDIDLAMTLGLNWPKGPLAWKKELSRHS